MNKTYYPSNLVTTIPNSKLKLDYKQIGFDLYKLAQTYPELSLATSTTDLTTFISSLQDKIVLFFQRLSNIDPMLVLTCNYYYYDSKKNIISKIKKETHPLYELFTISLSDVADNKQTFSIEISESKLFVFLLNYIYFNNPTSVDDTIIFNFKYLFMGALEKYLKSSQFDFGFTYEHYAVNVHTTKNLSYLNSQGLYFDFDSEYNFFIKQYENLFSSGSTGSYVESIIPNYYAAELYLDSEKNQILKNLVSLDNKVEVTKEKILSKQYFVDYSKELRKSSPVERLKTSKVKNYLIDSYYSTEQNNTLSSENFPYTGKIKFSNYPIDSLIEVLENKKLDTLSANNCHYIFADNPNLSEDLIPFSQNFYVKQQNIFKKQSDSGEYVDIDGISYDLSIKNVVLSESVSKTAVENIFNFVSNSNTQGGFAVYNQQDFSFISKENLKYLDLLKKPASVFHYIYLKTHLEQICNNSLDYFNVLELNALNVYPICYQIEKYNTSNTTSNIITIARNSKNSEVSLNDTQLAYEKTYRYKIYSINLINSFKYAFSDIIRTLSTNTLTGVVTLQKNPYIYKNLIIDKKFEIFDNPPTPVDVNIAPLIDSPNRMLFLLNTQSTKLLEFPKIIRTDDAKKFLNIRRKQNLNSKNILFETVEDLESVQIFRTTTPPRNYRSFEDSLYKVLSLQNITSNSFVDTLEQNIKYYYTFRSIDAHDNFSNPTEVFEVQIINNDGALYPVVSTYNMKQTQDNNYQYQKSFKKYVSINPSVLFTQLVNGENDVVNIGSENGFWNEQFKLRIKSKQSGKCFDINLSFNKIINNLIDNTNSFESISDNIADQDVEESSEDISSSDETLLDA